MHLIYKLDVLDENQLGEFYIYGTMMSHSPHNDTMRFVCIYEEHYVPNGEEKEFKCTSYVTAR